MYYSEEFLNRYTNKIHLQNRYANYIFKIDMQHTFSKQIFKRGNIFLLSKINSPLCGAVQLHLCPEKTNGTKMVIRGSRLQKQLPIYMLLSCWNVCLCNMQRLHFSHLHSLYGTRVLHTTYANLPPSAITYVTVLSSHLGQFRFQSSNYPELAVLKNKL